MSIDSSTPESDRGHGLAWVTGAALAAALMPGTCPACWPGYLGLAASLGLGATGAAHAPGFLFAILIAAAVGGLGRQAWRRRSIEVALAAVTGVALLLEARWLGGPASLRLIGVALLIGSAIECVRRPAPRVPVLIIIGRRD